MFPDAVKHAAEYIRDRISLRPKLSLILGSGLGKLAERIDGLVIPYSDIPGFPASTAPSHAGRLHIGKLNDCPIVAMQGRLHMYEGYGPQEVAFPVQVMAALGVETLVVTNAAGGLNPAYKAGDLVLIEDHLSLANLAGADPLRGPNDDRVGPRFTSMNKAYSHSLLAKADRTAEALGQSFARGVYGFAVGPTLETPAEVRALRTLGCDLVGMSTVPEVIAARHRDLDVLAISAVANMAITSIHTDEVTSAEAVFAAMETISPKLETFLDHLIPTLQKD